MFSQEFISKLQYILVYYVAIGLFILIYPREDLTDSLNVFGVNVVSSSGMYQLGIFDAFTILGLPICLLLLLKKIGFKPESNSGAEIKFPHWYEYLLFYSLATTPVLYVFFLAYQVLKIM